MLKMGFKKVYKALQEVFPEVDSRLLRAVAIEHQKDAYTAVEVIISEVIPYLNAKSSLSSLSSESSRAEQKLCSINGSRSGDGSPVGACASGTPGADDVHLQTATCPDDEQQGQFYDAQSDHDQLFHDANGILHQACGDSSIGKLASSKNYDEMPMAVSANVSFPMPFTLLIHENGAVPDDKICGDPKSEDAITSESYQESNIGVVCVQQTWSPSSALNHENLNVGQRVNDSLHVKSDDVENSQENNCADGVVLRVENSSDHVTQSSFGTSELCSAGSTESIDMPSILNVDALNEINDSETDTSKIGSPNELADVKDESTSSTGVTPSARICSIDLLEDTIADARNNKKTLFTAMESVISLMREVELQEKAAEKAKEEAADGDMEIFKRVEELKQMLRHAKEANDMHAGEVYGEKAILATEVKELQSRLLCLSDERDKSLGILDEMRRNLEVRLAAAEKEREAAEKEKLEKEELGRQLLAEQEKIMEKVVQEANILKQEAEENAKLQEFLVNRGRLVDMLQGEISVICKDVRLLKEKFDERLPLSQSLTSSQTSCLLASSSSSLKSMVAEQATDPSETTSEKTDPMSSLVEPGPLGAATMADDDHKALIEEGWEIFDNRGSYV